MNIKINLKSIGMGLLLLPFFEPAVFNIADSGFKSLSLTFSAFRVLISFYFIFIAAINIKLYKLNAPGYKYDLAFMAWITSMGIALLINDTVYPGFYRTLFCITGFYTLIKYNCNKSVYNFIKGLQSVLFILCFINLVTLITAPDGLMSGMIGDNRIWFLGGKNNFIVFGLPMMLAAYINRKFFNSNKKIFYLTYILFSLNGVIGRSSTYLLCWALITIYIFFKAWIPIKVLNAKFNTFTLLILMILLVVVNKITFINRIITMIFGKNESFSGRKAIWNQAIEYIQESPIFGVGVEKVYNPWTNDVLVNTAHNFFLETWVRYGVFTIISVVVLVILQSNFLDAFKHKSNEFIILTVFLFLISSLMEVFDLYSRTFFFVFPVFVVTALMRDLSGREKKYDEKNIKQELSSYKSPI